MPPPPNRPSQDCSGVSAHLLSGVSYIAPELWLCVTGNNWTVVFPGLQSACSLERAASERTICFDISSRRYTQIWCRGTENVPQTDELFPRYYPFYLLFLVSCFPEQHIKRRFSFVWKGHFSEVLVRKALLFANADRLSLAVFLDWNYKVANHY